MLNRGGVDTLVKDESAVRRLWAWCAQRIVRRRADLAVALLDTVLICAAFVATLLLRFDGSVSSENWDGLYSFLPVAVFVVLLSNGAWGLYGQLWRHASLYEARRLVLSGTTVTLILLLFEFGPRNVPLSVVFSGCVLGTFLMALLRFQSRLFSFRR